MPTPTPAYHPAVAPSAVAALERLVRRATSEQRLVQRAKLALLLQAQPTVGNTAAAPHLGQHPKPAGLAAVGQRSVDFPPGPRLGREGRGRVGLVRGGVGGGALGTR